MKKLLLILAIAGLTTSCGTQVSEGSSDFTSRITTTDEETSPNGLVAVCNTIEKASMGVNAMIVPLFINNSYSQDEIVMYLKQLDTSFYSGEHYLQFFRQQDSGSQLTTDTTPLLFKVVYKANSQEVIGMPLLNILSVGNLNSALNRSGLAGRYDANNFFDTFALKITNLPVAYESLLIVKYNSGETDYADYTSALIPSFDANPNTYANLGKSTDLLQIHPLYNYVGNTSYSDQQYKDVIENKCQNF